MCFPPRGARCAGRKTRRHRRPEVARALGDNRVWTAAPTISCLGSVIHNSLKARTDNTRLSDICSLRPVRISEACVVFSYGSPWSLGEAKLEPTPDPFGQGYGDFPPRALSALRGSFTASTAATLLLRVHC